MKRPKVIAILVIVVLLLIFLFQNTDIVTLRIYFWQISMSRIIFIPLVLVVGFALGFLAAKVTGKGARNKKSGGRPRP